MTKSKRRLSVWSVLRVLTTRLVGNGGTNEAKRCHQKHCSKAPTEKPDPNENGRVNHSVETVNRHLLRTKRTTHCETRYETRLPTSSRTWNARAPKSRRRTAKTRLRLQQTRTHYCAARSRARPSGTANIVRYCEYRATVPRYYCGSLPNEVHSPDHIRFRPTRLPLL